MSASSPRSPSSARREAQGPNVRLILFPGMDGTEVLLGPLLRSLAGACESEVVCYPQRGATGYEDLLPNALRAIDAVPADVDVALLGWSFGGPLAMRVAALRNERVSHLVLASTFVRPPLPWLRRARPLLVGPVVGSVRFLRRLPLWLSRPPSDPLRRDKAVLWQTVPANALARRARAVATVDAGNDLSRCRQRVLCLASPSDPVTPQHCVDEILRIARDAELVTLRGGHFALYSDAVAAAAAISRFLRIRGAAACGGEAAPA